MAVAWLIHGTLLERMAQDFVQERLHQEVEFLERQIRDSYPNVDTSLVTDSYFDEVFHHIFALRLGEQTAASDQHWREELQPWLAEPQSGFLTIKGDLPGSQLLAFRKAFEIDGTTAVIIVAEDYSTLQESQQELHLWTAVVSAVLLVFLVVLILLAVQMAMRPVAQLRQELSDLQAGSRDRLGEDVPAEFKGLTAQLNRLLDTLDNRLARSRQGMANLSHSVKTPVAALMQVLGDHGTPIEGTLREQMVSRLRDLNRQLESEMQRNQLAGPQAGKAASPLAQTREIAWMLGRLHGDRQFDIETDLPPNTRWPVEEHDFGELIGNLVDNAGKWAARRVRVTLAEAGNDLIITVEDDGKGVPSDARSGLGTRGMRLDEQKAGHGLGLAIVRDLTERYSGRLDFSESPMGGLQVAIRLPRNP